MNRTQHWYRIFRPFQVFHGTVLKQSNTSVLRGQRFFYNGNIKTPRRDGKYVFKAAMFTGSLLVGGIFVKLHSSTAKEHENNERHQEWSMNVENWQNAKTLLLSEAIVHCRDLVQRKKDETGSPGLTVAVSVDGKTVWTEGFGYSDVENRLQCTPQSVFRIASISKTITMAAVAKLLESGDLDLDKPVQFYVPEFPEKTWNGKKVQITTRQLLSHLGGIRHYRKDYMKDKTGADDSGKGKKLKSSSNGLADDKQPTAQRDKVVQEEPKDEMLLDEYYITRNYSSVLESLKIFKDDPLVHKPESEFLYTTHGWTLVSAVVEKAAKMPFEKYLQKTLDELGLENTFLDEHQPLIYNRGRHYVKNKKGRLENAPYVDLSYKWAGGGLVSNVLDMVKFGNAMLYSYQARTYTNTTHTSSSAHTDSDAPIANSDLNKSDGNIQHLPGFLRADTMKMLWTQVTVRESNWEGVSGGGYGLGWNVWHRKYRNAFCRDNKFFVSHTGAAIGASSVLLILPADSTVLESKIDDVSKSIKRDGLVSKSLYSSPPKGVVVVIIANMMSVGLNKTAYDIARIFERVSL